MRPLYACSSPPPSTPHKALPSPHISHHSRAVLNLGTKSFRAPEAADVDALIQVGASFLDPSICKLTMLPSSPSSHHHPCPSPSQAADKDGDGRINYQEFTRVMLETKGAL